MGGVAAGKAAKARGWLCGRGILPVKGLLPELRSAALGAIDDAMARMQQDGVQQGQGQVFCSCSSPTSSLHTLRRRRDAGATNEAMADLHLTAQRRRSITLTCQCT